MLRSPACATAADHPHGQWHRVAPAAHEVDLRRMIEQLVGRCGHEVAEHEVDERTRSAQGQADRDAHDRSLTDRGVAYPLPTVLVDEPLGEAKGAARRDV